MKKLLRTVLILILLLGMLSVYVFAADTAYQQSIALSDGTTLYNEIRTSGSTDAPKNVQCSYVICKQEAAVRPIVAYGNTLYGRSDMSAIAKYLKDSDLSLVAGVNGSFFDMSNGIPYGFVVTDGILRSSGNTNSIGFYPNGTAVIGMPELTVELVLNSGESIPLSYNKAATKQNGLVLYSQDYDAKTKNTIPCYHVVLHPVESSAAQLCVKEKVRLEVTGMLEDTQSCPIPDGSFVLAIAESTEYLTSLELLKSMEIGDTMQVRTSVSSDWENVLYACGGGDMLVENNAVCTAFTLDSAADSRARTAAGIRPDGSLVLFTADETSTSAGMTLAALAERMQQLGCITAINLDGGGSTTLGATYPGYASAATVNTPSDGAMRPCANFIYLVRDITDPLPASKLYVYPYSGCVLPGAQVSLTIKAADRSYMAAALPENGAVTAEGGKVEKGILTVAPDVSTVTVTAAAGSARGTAVFQVPDTVTGITLKKSSGTASLSKLQAGAESVTKLTASASWFGKTVYARNESFQWQADPAIGTVTADGTFTAAKVTKSTSGNLTVSYGSYIRTLPVTVSPADPFSDVKGHWAEDYINTLYYEGVLAGSTVNGKLCYRPGASMTRQEFIVALLRYLGTDVSRYASDTLPFDDASSISDWASDAMKAAYSLGYLSGSSSGGKLLSNPGSTISRQEAMVILSRTLKLGQTQDLTVLSKFTDSGKIADWAKNALAAMVEKGIISGSNGKLNPTGNVTRAEVAKMLYMMKYPE